MVPALILVFALSANQPTTMTTDRPQCPCPEPTSTTTTGPSETSTSRPALIIEPAHPAPPEPTTAPTAPASTEPTTTSVPVVGDSTVATRPQKRLPYTGLSGRGLVAGGVLVLLGALFVAAGRNPPRATRRTRRP